MPRPLPEGAGPSLKLYLQRSPPSSKPRGVNTEKNGCEALEVSWALADAAPAHGVLPEHRDLRLVPGPETPGELRVLLELIALGHPVVASFTGLSSCCSLGRQDGGTASLLLRERVNQRLREDRNCSEGRARVPAGLEGVRTVKESELSGHLFCT